MTPTVTEAVIVRISRPPTATTSTSIRPALITKDTAPPLSVRRYGPNGPPGLCQRRERAVSSTGRPLYLAAEPRRSRTGPKLCYVRYDPYQTLTVYSSMLRGPRPRIDASTDTVSAMPGADDGIGMVSTSWGPAHVPA